MRNLRQYRADVEIKRAPLPASMRRALVEAGCRTYACVLLLPEAPPEALAWARERDAAERARKLAESLGAGRESWRIKHC